MTYLAAVTHEIKTNTLEATWLEDTGTEIKRIKCHNYSASQAEMFLADTGPEGQRYLDAAGWTPEFCAAFTAENERIAAEVKAKADAEVAVKESERLAAEKVAFDAAVAQQVAILKAAALIAAE